MKHYRIGAALAACGLIVLAVEASGARSASLSESEDVQAPFTELELHLEVDLRTLATELVLESKALEPMIQVALYDGAGTQLFDLNPASFQGIGLSEISAEAEAVSFGVACSLYPEGEYAVHGLTLSGKPVTGKVQLSHRLPGPFRLLPVEQSPLDGSVTIAWTASARAARYVLEVESDVLGESFEFVLGNQRTRVTLPGEFFQQQVPYEISLVSEGDSDNELEIEAGFQLAGF